MNATSIDASGQGDQGKRGTRPRRLLKGCAIGCGGLLALALLAVMILAWWKPWAPDIQVADPGPGGTRITDGGLIGNYYPAKSGKGGAVLVLGGSEGGLHPMVDHEARALADAGISALAISYWGAPGQKERMEDLPLETFDTALTWLGRQQGVDPARLGVVGTSKGGEAAMLVASRRPDLKAVVGVVPSHVVWQGFDQAEFWRMFSGMGSTWSAQGKPVPFLPYAGSPQGRELAAMYRESLATLPQHPDAVIPVEKAKAPLLLVCGGADTMWPSCDMSREIQKRAAEHGSPTVTVLAYPDAGHAAGGPPMPAGTPIPESIASLGGTPEGNAASRRDSWPKTIEFLSTNLSR